MKYEKAKCKCGKYLIIVRPEHQYYQYKVLLKGNLKLYDTYLIEKKEGYYECPSCDRGYHVREGKGGYIKGEMMKRENEE